MTPTDIETLIEARAKRGRRTFLMVVAVAVLPIIAAYFAFFTGVGVPQKTVNAGTLFPTPLAITQLSEDYNEAFPEKKWRLFLPVTQTCDKACEAMLYTTRQVHIRLDREANRLERVLINLGGANSETLDKALLDRYKPMKKIDVADDEWQRWLKGAGLELPQGDYYLLVDQEGYAMMLYSNQTGNQLLKDLKHALKYSIDYQSK